MIKFVAVLLAFLYSGASLAASATVQSLTGDVKASVGTAAPTALTKDTALESGMTIATGDNSNIVMKFEDGQVVVLNANTTFKITRYQYNAAQPQSGNAFFSLVKGAMRSISGLIGKHNSGGFRLQTPVATIGIRGTDFMAASGSLYLSVGQGVVSATSTAGTSTFTAGQLGFVSNLTALPSSIAASQLPASVASSFSQLGGIAVPSTGAASGSGTSNTGYGNTSTGSTTSSGSTTGSSTASSGPTGSATGSTAGTTGTAAGGATGAGGATATSTAVGGGLGTVTTVSTVAAVGAAAAALATKQTGASTTVTATVTQ